MTKVDQKRCVLQRAESSCALYSPNTMADTPDWVAISGLIFVTMITPGPNNALALRAGVSRDCSGVAAVIAGVQLGGIILLALCWAGVTAVMSAHPLAAPGLTLVGGAYLAWLGWTLIRSNGAAGPGALRSIGTVGVTTLQFANPKAWLFMATLGSATAGSLTALWKASALYLAISVASLGLWSAAGAELAHWLSSSERRRLFDRVLGLLLIVSALALVVSNLLRGVSHVH